MKQQIIDKVYSLIGEELRARNTSVQIPEPFSGLINYRDDTITLHYLLKAIGKLDIDNTDIDEYAVGRHGDIWEMNYSCGNECNTQWNFSKSDNLKDQLEDNPELVKFLAGIFIN